MERLPRGELEAQVMNVVWDADHWVTPRDVQVAVSSPRRPLAYTTVMTILVRLWSKEMLERRPEGRAFAYRSVTTRDEWAAQRMHEMLETSGDRLVTLHHFVDSITTREATQLKRALEDRKRR